MDDFSVTNESTIALIADQCPRAMSAYFICLRNVDSYGSVTFDKNFIKNTSHKSWTKFKNDIRSLGRVFVLNFIDHGNEIEIELIGEDFDSPMLQPML